MIRSISPKNANHINYHSNEGDIIPSTGNNLFQRNDYNKGKEGINEEIGNGIKFKSNINFNTNDIKYNSPQLNSYKNISNLEIYSENKYKNMNDDYRKINTNNNISSNLNNLNFNHNNQKNSINLNLGIQAKKNYSTPILNETSPRMKQDENYNKSLDMFERMQFNKNMQNKNFGNDEYYLSQIEELKKEINNLKNNNEYLNIQLKEEQKKNEQLLSIQKAKDEEENSILSEICHSLQVSSFDEILPKLNEIINYLNNNVKINKNNNKDNNNKIRDELISKMQNLYLSLTGSNEKKEEITIQILWRWIKHLINTVKQLALEKEKNLEMFQNMQEIDEYKEYCEELISDFNLQSLDELKMFINNLLKQNNIIKENENQDNQQEIRNIPMVNQSKNIEQQQQYQMQNYQKEEENDDGGEEQIVEEEEEGELEGEGEGEGIGEGEGEGEEEGEQIENIDPNDPNQQQYENENEYDENNENDIIQQQMELNNQNNPNEGNYNYKYDENINLGNE